MMALITSYLTRRSDASFILFFVGLVLVGNGVINIMFGFTVRRQSTQQWLNATAAHATPAARRPPSTCPFVCSSALC